MPAETAATIPDIIRNYAPTNFVCLSVTDSDAKHVEKRCYDKIEELKTKRSKSSLVARKVLLDTVHGAGTAKCPASYMKKKSAKAVAVNKYLEDIAIDLSAKASVTRREKVARKVLPKRVKRLHKEYNMQHPNLKVSRASFYRHIPKHVMTAGKQKMRQGLCEICTGVDLKVDVLNRYMETPIDGRDCLSESSLCPEPKIICYDRKCGDCGVQVVHDKIYCNLTADTDTPVRWSQWEMVSNTNGKGKRKDLVEKHGTLDQLISLILKELVTFSRHLFVFRWQHQQFRNAKLSVSAHPSVAVAICDFAENFTCHHQDEVQSAHWGYSQVTVHPTVLYYKCSHCDEIVTHYLVFFTDDITKDAALAKVILDKTIKFLTDKVTGLNELIVFSDGCAAQFKSRLPLFHLANSTAPVAVTRAYFGSRHGKSPCDSCGGVVKCCVDEDVRAGEARVQNALDMYSHCQDTLVLPEVGADRGSCCHIQRSFALVLPEEIDRSISSSIVSTLPGTRSLHSIRSTGTANVIQTRKLSCFCRGCLDHRSSDCENCDTVGSWESVKLKLNKSPAVILPEADIAESQEPQEVTTLSSESEIQPSTLNMPVQQVPKSLSPFLPRYQYFKQLHQALMKCTNFDQVKVVVSGSGIEAYKLPSLSQFTIAAIKGTVDRVALDLRPQDCPSDLFPVLINGDGNCLPRSLSTLAYGKESHHIEMRCRLLFEMVQNFSLYVRGVGMGSDAHMVVAYLAILSEESALTLEAVTEEDVRDALMRETMQIRQNGMTMGLWQLAAAANVLGAPICSVYPDKGWAVHRNLNNRTLRPLNPQQHGCVVYIMWTSTRDDVIETHWTANHFVPLLHISTANETITVDCGPFSLYNKFRLSDVNVSDFFILTWKGQDIVGRVDEILADSMLFLNFMVNERGFLVWPLSPDTSHEHIAVLKEKVQMEFVSEKSSYRKQYYRMV